ncbi:hypothetical protein JX265_006691 [Neoarthrinium moseri]|uniref:Charged multivesicular body protein 6 n=1 Tax=Neoarthrinium moseri TaxID=1658444 RepID=A0A9Q0AQD0_9PEZI|nr:hypothetical protein JX265_006691 [Neoarthrinium moseri]
MQPMQPMQPIDLGPGHATPMTTAPFPGCPSPRAAYNSSCSSLTPQPAADRLPSPIPYCRQANPERLRAAPPTRAILDLKLQRDKLHQYQRRITALTAAETAAARQMLAAGNKPRALLALRRKKYQESLLAKTDAQLEQLEQLVRSVEFAQIQKDIVFGLAQGTKVLKEIHAEMGGIEKVEMLMGENAEAIAYQEEISEMLGGRISNQDEEEVEDELAALELEVNGPLNSEMSGTPVLPNVPDTRLPETPDAEPETAAAKQRQQQQEERRQAVPA